MSELIGKTIVEVREMTQEEKETEGWGYAQWSNEVVLIMDDGTKVFPSQDQEGNGPGALFGTKQDGSGVIYDASN